MCDSPLQCNMLSQVQQARPVPLTMMQGGYFRVPGGTSPSARGADQPEFTGVLRCSKTLIG
jgi:hypothetical protein